MNEQLVGLTKAYMSGADASSLMVQLRSGSRNDIEAQAIVRYLRAIDKWSLEEGSEFAETLEFLFGAYPERDMPKDYVAQTSKLILAAFEFEFPAVIEREAPKPLNTGSKGPKKTKRRLPEGVTEVEVEGKSGSRIFKSLSGDVDTSQASDHLRRTIEIQRNG